MRAPHLHKPYERCYPDCPEQLPVAHYQPVDWNEEHCPACHARWDRLGDVHVAQMFDLVTCTAKVRT